MGHGHVIPSLSGYKARCGGPSVCLVCKEESRLANSTDRPKQPEWQLVTDTRLVEILRGYVSYHSDEVSRPDMNNERRLLDLMHLALDEENALRVGRGIVVKRQG